MMLQQPAFACRPAPGRRRSPFSARVAAPALAATLLGCPAQAETWDCAFVEVCETGRLCEGPTGGMTVAIEIAGDGSSGRLLKARGKANETWAPLRLIGESSKVRTFMTDFDDGEPGFLSLFAEGAVAASSHGNQDGGAWASAAKGTCTRTDD
jgi:hypothetical protein